MALRRQINAIKRQEFPRMLRITKCALQMVIKQLGAAFKNFFAGRACSPHFAGKIMSTTISKRAGRSRVPPRARWMNTARCKTLPATSSAKHAALPLAR